jgi:riboflavin kinase, archaea type
MKIAGRVQSGCGRGAFFTQLDWVIQEFEQKLGFRPFPGTLNVRINEEDFSKLYPLLKQMDFEILPIDKSFCTAKVKRVQLNDISVAVVFPSEDVRIHKEQIIEIISEFNLKQTLGLNDGDSVYISWD